MEDAEDHEQLRVGGHCSVNTHPGRSLSRASGASSLPCSAARRVENPARGDDHLDRGRYPRSSPSTPAILKARVPPGGSAARAAVPGVIYGGDGEPSHFAVDARILRNTLARSGAILDIAVDGGKKAPRCRSRTVQRHPVRGDIMHVDFIRVNMNETIHGRRSCSTSSARKTLPASSRAACSARRRARGPHRGAAGRHPGHDQHDVSGMQMNDIAHLGGDHRAEGRHAARRPRGDRHRDDHPADARAGRDEIEVETALVGEDGEAAEGRRAEEAAQAAIPPKTPRTSPEGLQLHTGRLARSSGSATPARLRRDAAQRRLQGRRGAGPPLGPAARRRRSSRASSPRGARAPAVRAWRS